MSETEGESNPRMALLSSLTALLEEGSLVTGYVVFIKAMDPEGDDFYAARFDGLSVMERLGMVVSFGDDLREDLKKLAQPSGTDE